MVRAFLLIILLTVQTVGANDLPVKHPQLKGSNILLLDSDQRFFFQSGLEVKSYNIKTKRVNSVLKLPAPKNLYNPEVTFVNSKGPFYYSGEGCGSHQSVIWKLSTSTSKPSMLFPCDNKKTAEQSGPVLSPNRKLLIFSDKKQLVLFSLQSAVRTHLRVPGEFTALAWNSKSTKVMLTNNVGTGGQGYSIYDVDSQIVTPVKGLSGKDGEFNCGGFGGWISDESFYMGILHQRQCVLAVFNTEGKINFLEPNLSPYGTYIISPSKKLMVAIDDDGPDATGGISVYQTDFKISPTKLRPYYNQQWDCEINKKPYGDSYGNKTVKAGDKLRFSLGCLNIRYLDKNSSFDSGSELDKDTGMIVTKSRLMTLEKSTHDCDIKSGLGQDENFHCNISCDTGTLGLTFKPKTKSGFFIENIKKNAQMRYYDLINCVDTGDARD
jgi:hypothetical protein